MKSKLIKAEIKKLIDQAKRECNKAECAATINYLQGKIIGLGQLYDRFWKD